MENNQSSQQKAQNIDWVLTVETLFKDKPFDVRHLSSPIWMADNHRFSYTDKLPESDIVGLWMFDCSSNTRTIVTPLSTLLHSPDDTEGPKPLPISGYQWSPDETRVLIANVPARRSSQGNSRLYVYDVAKQQLACITPVTGQYRCARWSPDGTAVGYVRDNNIWFIRLEDGQETQCTFTGDKLLYNGVFGWVYEEELDMVAGWEWSPDGKEIAFFETGESNVPEILIPDYNQHTMVPASTRYPQAGDANPVVRVGILAIGNLAAAPRWLNTGMDATDYLTALQWLPGGDLLLQRTPRLQQKIELLRYRLGSTEPDILLTEADDCWLTPHGQVTIVDNGDSFLWLSSRDGYTHIYQYFIQGGDPIQITSGEWEVDTIVGIDTGRNAVMFSAGLPNPMSRTIYRAPLGKHGEMTLLSQPTGTSHCVPTRDGSKFILAHSSVTSVNKTVLVTDAASEPFVLVENRLPFLEKLHLAQVEFLQIPAADGTPLNAVVAKPADFDPTRKYPVLMYTYGGPSSQVVQDNWGSVAGGLGQLLAQEGVVTVRVDNRGTGMRGRKFCKCTYLRMGILESDDQIAAAKWIATQDWVDAGRIGIWGWSYGGFMAALCILRGAGVFRTAISGAPVTDWKFYDSIYTERYMQRPADNPAGYAETSPVELAHLLQGSLLLVHGTADDNVHYRNSMVLAAKLQSANLPFEIMTYPHCKHGLGSATQHFYEMLLQYLRRTLINPRN